MNLSFIRGLTASILSNVSSLRKQAKRLQKAAPELLGRQLTLEECQEIVARTNGFKQWSDINELAVKTGADRSCPSWHIFSRNNFHEKILAALTGLEVDLLPDRPLVILGKPRDVAATATCLWAELISVRKVPGLLLIETLNQTVQDTALWEAITALGITEIFDRFRVIDAREKKIPVAVTATASHWVDAIVNLLTESERCEFESSAGRHLFERIIVIYSVQSNWITHDRQDVSFRMVEQAANFLRNPEIFRHSLLAGLKDGVEKTGLEMDIDAYLARNLSKTVLDNVLKIVDAIADREIGYGTVMWKETEYRPTIVLFSRQDKASEVVASAIHEMYFGRYVVPRDIRPILYFSDTGYREIPLLLGFGSETIIANGSESREDSEWSLVTTRRGMFGSVSNGFFSYSGRKADVSSDRLV